MSASKIVDELLGRPRAEIEADLQGVVSKRRALEREEQLHRLRS